MSSCWQCALANLCCVQRAVRDVNSCFRCWGSFGSSWNQLLLTPAGSAAGWMGSLWWTVAHFPCCRRNGLQSLPPSALELSLTAFHILQLQKNKKVLRIVAIKASACYLIYKCPYTLYTAYILSIQLFLRQNSSAPLSAGSVLEWQEVWWKLLKSQPDPANRWELARVQVLWDTVEGQGQVCAANCTADIAVLRICHWSPPSTATVLPYIPTQVLMKNSNRHSTMFNHCN